MTVGSVTIHETRFTEDEITDGDIPYDDDHMTTTVYDDVSAAVAASTLARHGLSFVATGNDWAADPDGSYVSNYATGERVETSGHFSGFHARVVAAIMDRVG